MKLPENSDRSLRVRDASEAHFRVVAADEADRVLVRFCRDKLDLDIEDGSALKSFRLDIAYARRGRLRMEARLGIMKVAYVAGITAVISAIVTYLVSSITAWIHFGKPPQ